MTLENDFLVFVSPLMPVEDLGLDKKPEYLKSAKECFDNADSPDCEITFCKIVNLSKPV